MLFAALACCNVPALQHAARVATRRPRCNTPHALQHAACVATRRTRSFSDMRLNELDVELPSTVGSPSVYRQAPALPTQCALLSEYSLVSTH